MFKSSPIRTCAKFEPVKEAETEIPSVELVAELVKVMDGEVKVAINYDRIADDTKWDGLKGYLTNTDMPIQDVYTAYHNLWHVERAFRIAKSKIEIRPMFHFTRKRIEAHICICFVALKVYRELERMLKDSGIKMSVDKVLALAKTITTIQIKLPLNKEVCTQTMLREFGIRKAIKKLVI